MIPAYLEEMSSTFTPAPPTPATIMKISAMQIKTTLHHLVSMVRYVIATIDTEIPVTPTRWKHLLELTTLRMPLLGIMSEIMEMPTPVMVPTKLGRAEIVPFFFKFVLLIN